MSERAGSLLPPLCFGKVAPIRKGAEGGLRLKENEKARPSALPSLMLEFDIATVFLWPYFF
jgi:hypothetical protein